MSSLHVKTFQMYLFYVSFGYREVRTIDDLASRQSQSPKSGFSKVAIFVLLLICIDDNLFSPKAVG